MSDGKAAEILKGSGKLRQIWRDWRSDVAWRDVLKVHPAADLFPMMSDDELKALADDIKQHGLRQPIVYFEDDEGNAVIVDGRNRLAAMDLLGDEVRLKSPLVSKLSADADIFATVISLNIHRRHLTAEQKRELIAKVIKAEPGKSDRQIAATVKADHKTVAAVRSKQEARGEIPHVETRTDTRGRTQPARKHHHRSSGDGFAARAAAASTEAAVVVSVPVPAAKPKSQLSGQVLNSLLWSEATPDLRRRFVSAVGLRALIEACPEGERMVVLTEYHRAIKNAAVIRRAATAGTNLKPPDDLSIPDYLRRNTASAAV